jgi:energy-coupling factor transport system ATP-binding protein
LNGQGHTVLLISHDMELVAEYAQRVLLMHEGQSIADGPPATFFAQHELLQRTGLIPPQAAGLAARLSDIGMPPETPTVDAFVRAYVDLLPAGDADAR